MTILMTQPWNGLMSQQRYTLATVEEARLVSLGVATYDLDGDPDPEGGLVRFSRNLTGGIKNFSAGDVDMIAELGIKPAGNRVLLVGDSFQQANNFFWYGTGLITSIVRASGVCTVTITAHTLATGRRVRMVNVPEAGFNGLYEITVTGANSFTFACPGADATATRTSASVIADDWFGFGGPFLWANMQLGGGLVAVNRCVGGYTTAQVLADLQANIDANSPAEVWNVSGYNDISTSGFTAQTTIDNITAMAALCAANGLVFRTATMAPLGTASAKWGAAATAWVNTVNRALRSLPYAYKNAYVADVYPALVDSTNTTNAGVAASGVLQTDGIHPSIRGAQKYGQAFAATFEATPPRAGVFSYADYGSAAGSYSVFDSGPWATSGGTCNARSTGTAGGSITIDRNSGTGTAVASVVQPAIGGNAQQLVITSTDASKFTIRSNNGTSIIPRLTEGELRRLCAYVSVAGIANPNFKDITIEVFFTIAGTSYYYTIGTSSTMGYEPTADFSGILISNDYIEIPDPATIANAGWRAIINTGGASGGALTVQVGMVGFIL